MNYLSKFSLLIRDKVSFSFKPLWTLLTAVYALYSEYSGSEGNILLITNGNFLCDSIFSSISEVKMKCKHNYVYDRIIFPIQLLRAHLTSDMEIKERMIILCFTAWYYICRSSSLLEKRNEWFNCLFLCCFNIANPKGMILGWELPTG